MHVNEQHHRLRVLADREPIESHDALYRVGCSPGERTFTNNWIFWHGFNVDVLDETNTHCKKLKAATHGKGCGGSSEWIGLLRQRRADLNRKIAQQINFSKMQVRRRPKHTAELHLA